MLVGSGRWDCWLGCVLFALCARALAQYLHNVVVRSQTNSPAFAAPFFCDEGGACEVVAACSLTRRCTFADIIISIVAS